MRLLLAILIFLFGQKNTVAQKFSDKDFKLVLEGHSSTDSTISFDELSKLNTVTGNFYWLQVNELNISYGGQCYGGKGYFEVNCKNNSICQEAVLPKRFFSAPGGFIVIASSNTTDKAGRKVKIKPLILWLKR